MRLKPATLKPLQGRVLGQLAAVQCATLDQLCNFCGSQKPHISTAAAALVEMGLVEVEQFVRPRILRISRQGCQLLGVPAPAGQRLPSWSVMAHACHLNELALVMAKAVPGFRFASRLSLLKQGFNPGHGEHAAVDGSGMSWFVLLDDFLMGSDRIARAWRRRHTPNAKYWPDPTGRAWGEVMQRFLVVTTDEGQAERHRARIARDQLPAEVMTIKPLWKG